MIFSYTIYSLKPVYFFWVTDGKRELMAYIKMLVGEQWGEEDDEEGEKNDAAGGE